MTQYLNRHLIEAFILERTAVGLAEEVVFCDQAQSRSFAGRAAVEAVWQVLFADGFAEVRIEVQRLITDDTAAALEFTFRGGIVAVSWGFRPPAGKLPFRWRCFAGSNHRIRIRNSAVVLSW